jgi:hypothetical protein
MLRPGLLSALVLSLSASLGAAANPCNLDLRYEAGELRWNAIPGVEQYQVLESFDEFATARGTKTRNSAFTTARRTTAPTNVFYQVTAEFAVGTRALAVPSIDTCTARLTVQLAADSQLRQLTRMAVLPIAGSTPGAQGAKFKTSLTLRGVSLKGKLVFHPVGRAALPGDPTLAYNLGNSGAPIVYDDVVAAMGQTGLGSIDIVPDDDADGRVPRIEARMFNETTGGTFGTFAPAVLPYQYLHPGSVQVQIPEGSRFRVNLGIRTLTATTSTALIYGADGRLRDFVELTFPAQYTTMISAADFVRRPLAPGDSVTLTFSGSAIPFYTITDNSTNDPTLVVPPPRAMSLTVDEYVD